MAKTYTKTELKEIIAKSRQLKSETVSMHSRLIYNAQMWLMKEK